MKKVLRKWLVATMAVALVLASSIGVLAAGEGASEDAGIKVIKSGTTEEFGMFVVSSSSAVVDGEEIKISLETANTSYDKIYFGSKDDADKTNAVQGTSSAGWSFTLKVPAANAGQNVAVALGKNDETWYKNQLYLSVPNVDDGATVTTGVRVLKEDTDDISKEYGMFIVSQCSVSRNGDEITIKLETANTSYDKIFIGAKADATTAAAAVGTRLGGWKFEFSVPKSAAGTNLSVVLGKPNETWYTSKALEMTIPSLDALNPNNPDDNPQQPVETQVILPDGTYSVDVATGTKMFKVVDCKLVVAGDKVSALVTLSSNGYDYLYVGTKEEAAAASQSTWSKWIKEIPTEGKPQRMYKIEMTKDALSSGLSVASHSESKNSWFDRKLTFDLSSLKIYSIGNNVDDAINNVVTDKTPSDNNSAGNTNNSNTSNNSNNTLTQDQINDKLQSVDSSSVVKDGTYTPSFGFEGGSGRATIACNKVVVKNGKATATIVFSSPNFTWVKTGGKTYYNENKGGNSTFTIPVTLNGKTAISAETTAMSQPHVIDYTLYCFIDGTKVTTKNNTSTDTIELGTEADNTTADKDDANSWGEFDSETDATKAYESKIKGLTTGLVVVGGYAVAGTAFAAVRFRKLRKK